MSRWFGISSLLLVLMAACGEVQSDENSDIRLLPAKTHRNLSVYLIEGSPTTNLTDFLTLKEGLEKNLVVVHETGDVGELAIENRSDRPLYVGSGEIVSGGRQDRVLQNDMIVAANSEKIPLPAFCVEHGRWSERKGEAATHFESSEKMIPNKELKKATTVVASQTEVWNEVAALRKELDTKSEVFIRGGRATGSLYQLVEDEQVTKLTDEYRASFANILEQYPDAIGFAFAIGDSINSAESYRSRELFERMWPKLIDAAAVEAVSHFDSTATCNAPSAATVFDWMTTCRQGTMEEREVNAWTSVRRFTSDEGTLFETIWVDSGELLHRSYLHE